MKTKIKDLAILSNEEVLKEFEAVELKGGNALQVEGDNYYCPAHNIECIFPPIEDKASKCKKI